MQYDNYDSFISKELPAIADWLNRIDAKAKSFTHASVEEIVEKYHRETFRVSWSEEGLNIPEALSADLRPSTVEMEKIAAQLRAAKFPKVVLVKEVSDAEGDISAFRDARKDYQFEIRDASGNLLMIRARVDIERDGKAAKIFPSWIPLDWGDGQVFWGKMDYPGALPLFGMERIKRGRNVFIFEGERKALRARQIAEKEPGHPFHPFLKEDAVFVAFQGGAHAIERADWAALNRHLSADSVVYIWPDNDSVSLDGVPQIAKQLKSKCRAILVSHDNFPAGWDIANEIPEKLMRGGIYAGPSLLEMQRPASWLTRLVPVPVEEGSRRKPKEIAVLRENVKREWIFCAKDGLFAHESLPIELSAETLNLKLRPFSDTKDVAELYSRNYSGDVDRIAYRPNAKPRERILDRATGDYAINTYRPSVMTGKQGDPSPFLEYMQYLVPNAGDRLQLLRWAATMVSRPEIKTPFAVILSSITQGTGKTIFASKILASLVGPHNVSYLTENAITSEFNGWWFQRRLAIASELHLGSAYAAYNGLKQIVTDDQVPLRRMYQEMTTRENWCQVIITSNDPEPIKIPAEDRRWLCVAATETAWKKEKFSEFAAWLDGGGLEIVRGFFDKFCNYAQVGEDAEKSGLRHVYGDIYAFVLNVVERDHVTPLRYLKPNEAPADSDLKTEIIETSANRATRLLREKLQEMADSKKPAILFDCKIIDWLAYRGDHGGDKGEDRFKCYEKPKSVRVAASRIQGLEVGKVKIKIDKQTGYAIANKAALDELQVTNLDEAQNEHLKEISKVCGGTYLPVPF